MRLHSIINFLGICDAHSLNGKSPPLEDHSGQECEGEGWCQDCSDDGVAIRSITKVQWGILAKSLQDAQLDELMEKASANVQPWDTGRFTLVSKLQDAVRNHGCVDKMMYLENDGNARPVAVKRMPTKWVTSGPSQFNQKYPSAPERPWCDIALLGELNRLGFPYACELIGVFRDEENTYMVASLAEQGDLFSWCERGPFGGGKREASMFPIVNQLCQAVGMLHELGISHRDLSLENTLLTDMGGGLLQVKIIDFGMASTSRMSHRLYGKQSYQAPEMHVCGRYDAFLADVFALGVVIFAMAARDYPWTSTKSKVCHLHEFVRRFGLRKFLERRKLRNGNGENLINVFSSSLVELLEGMLHQDARVRSCLGESCFYSDVKERGRKSVWQTSWMRSPPRPCAP